ncbi:DUF2567 domain-containing protein [Gordonia sp. CPCC 205515]|uniref:DUF2567 domain-containing protein n=1 Tax=Gordonia sp. CPCC 205515 TaxID=3140791 RepID=UPI003AF3D9EC
MKTPTISRLAEIVAAVLLVGIVGGVVWAFVTPAMSGRVVGDNSAIIPATQFDQEFAGVAVFAGIMLVVGVIAAAIGWVRGREWRGPWEFLAIAVASFIGSILAMVIGTQVAHWRFGDPHSMPVGSSFQVVPDLWLDGSVSGFGSEIVLLICAPMAATLVYLTCALSSRHPDLGVGDLPGTPDPQLVGSSAP